MVIDVRPQRADEAALVHDVVERAFGDAVVAELWDALARRPRSLSFVAETDGEVVGHVGLTWCWIDAPDRLVDVLVLSPLSVVPERQRSGVGRALAARAIDVADEQGSPLLFLEGDPAYYSRVGFEPAGPLGFTPPSVRIPMPGFQCVRLSAYDPSITGALVYADTFWAFDCVGLRGERLDRSRG
ncbi:MAG TPA: N-acetyltransferase [Candidatus Angelobacter sp.]|nr:N-acetyltransferase [Candidatus Angelobacter sp.]